MDIVVGLVSYNAGITIGHVLTAVHEGLTQSFGSATSRIVLADSGSTDDTVARARGTLNGRDMLEVPSPQTPA
ncbi:MAG TPA: glycosyltransferase, partial [Gemmatimonadaceae bacterium]|nr:glycosyltransferase [Gemmatimonadaceae bacterium]